MELKALDAGISGLYSTLMLDYLNRNEGLKPFIANWPEDEGFRAQIELQKNRKTDRMHLHAALSAQYREVPAHKAVQENLDLLLKPTTYTITTGQQIHIFLGPMYVYWKILSTLALCRKLKNENPQLDFVPVFWMASEDHDFAEVNHLEVFNRSFVWEDDEPFAIPVGRRKPQGILPMVDELDPLFERDEKWKGYASLFREAYSSTASFAEATRMILNELFGASGLVVLDPDSVSLKRDFLPVVQAELKNGKSYGWVEDHTRLLEENYERQVNPRPINLFYTGHKGRERIEKADGILRTQSGEELCRIGETDEWAEKNLENISANVVLRPVYQECILPNIAYIGGPGELAYWMQLKGVFDGFGIPFPVLENRKSVFILGKRTGLQMEKLNLDIEDLFLDITDLRIKAVERSKDGLLSLNEEVQELLVLKDKVIGKAASRLPAQAKPLAEIFNQGEKLIRKIDKEIFNLQQAVLEKDLEKIVKTKAILKDKSYTQERNQYLVQYLSRLDTTQIIEQLSKKYKETGPVCLLFTEN